MTDRVYGSGKHVDIDRRRLPRRPRGDGVRRLHSPGSPVVTAPVETFEPTPEGQARRAAVLVARMRALRSQRTARRFRGRLELLSVLGIWLWLIGFPPVPVVAALCLGLSLAATLQGVARHGANLPPYLDHVDEAAWLFMLGHALRVLPPT